MNWSAMIRRTPCRVSSATLMPRSRATRSTSAFSSAGSCAAIPFFTTSVCTHGEAAVRHAASRRGTRRQRRGTGRHLPAVRSVVVKPLSRYSQPRTRFRLERLLAVCRSPRLPAVCCRCCVHRLGPSSFPSCEGGLRRSQRSFSRLEIRGYSRAMSNIKSPRRRASGPRPRQHTKHATIGFPLPREHREALRLQAEQQGVALSDLMRRIVRQHLDAGGHHGATG